ncbi:MAG: glutaredoxin family protein [Nannocystaceae bacterium]
MSEIDPLPERHASPVVLYGRHSCIFCRMAMQWFAEHGVEHRFISVEGDQVRREAIARLSGQHTVPQIFVRGQSIGGYRELLAEAASGELERRLSEDRENDDDVG